MVLGITGGVGCGKSTVLKLLETEYGARVMLADDIGHEMMEQGKPAWLEIRKQFGDGILTPEGEVDRDRLASLIYQDEEKRQQLNGIIHPCVRKEMERRIEEWREEPLVVLETALLFETGCDILCDEIWWVDAGRELRIRRLMDSRGYTRQKAEAIMNRQMSEDDWRVKCHHRIDNNEEEKKLSVQIKELLGRL